jgi:hypothetical protein
VKEKKRWGVLSHLKEVKQEDKINWAKVWRNRTHTDSKFISLEDKLDNEDFERVQQLIQEKIVLTKKVALEKAEKESSSSSSSSSFSSSSESSSRSSSSSPSSSLFSTFNKLENASMEEELDKALSDL